jgi:hypothetical protein
MRFTSHRYSLGQDALPLSVELLLELFLVVEQTMGSFFDLQHGDADGHVQTETMDLGSATRLRLNLPVLSEAELMPFLPIAQAAAIPTPADKHGIGRDTTTRREHRLLQPRTQHHPILPRLVLVGEAALDVPSGFGGGPVFEQFIQHGHRHDSDIILG